MFLPHRIDVQRNFLEASPGCGGPLPSVDAGVPAPDPGPGPGADAGVIALRAPSPARTAGALRTLGGQPVVDHPH